MRLTQPLLVAGLFGPATATLDASVFSFGPSKHQHPKRDILSVEPSTARLYLAQRLRLSGYHNLEGADTITLGLLNEDLNSQRPLFAEHATKDAKRVVLFLEGVDNPQELLGLNSDPVFTIKDTPSPALNSILAQDLHCQSKQINDSPERCDTAESHTLLDALDPLSSISVAYVSNLESSALPIEQRTKSAEILKMKLTEIQSSSELDTTVVFFPTVTKVSRRGLSDWGSYGNPSSNHKTRHTEKETLLSEIDQFSSNQLEASGTPVASKFQNTTIPRATIASCYSSMENCIKATANCTGHGECFKKFTEKVDPNEEGAECWACKCSWTNIPRDAGSQRIFWGGPACQKKDVSTPFFLLAGFTIVAVSIVSWGIGLLFSVGNEQLPSVLSAGISGPTARK